MKKEDSLTEAELRKKLDGFKIVLGSDKSEEGYKTVDKGVYWPPDDSYNDSNNKK